MNQEHLWSAHEIAAVTGGTASGTWFSSGVSINTRTLKVGDLFVAIRGPMFDGHQFAAEAVKKGASGLLIDTHPANLPERAPIVLVNDTLAALHALGNASRRRSEALIIAVTGSVGKTSTKNALYHALSLQGQTTCSQASHNNFWGVPLSLSQMARRDQFGIFEVGMSHPGEISPLSKMISPNIAIITNVEPAHTANFDSLELVAKEKAEIFDGLEPSGVAVLNADNKFFSYLKARSKSVGVRNLLTFGSASDADTRLISLSSDCQGSYIEASIKGKRISYKVSLPGKHQVMNSLATLTAIHAAGADIDAAAASFGQLVPLPGRGKSYQCRILGGSIKLIDESYNANPASMRAALDNLGNTKIDPPGRRIAVLGDMLELGRNSQTYHLNLAPTILKNQVEKIFAVGNQMEGLFESLPPDMQCFFSADTKGLTKEILKILQPNDIVLVKGSNAVGMASVVTEIRAELGGYCKPLRGRLENAV